MDSPRLIIALPDLAAAERLGAMLGAVLGPGDVVALSGPLGAGKTTLARAAIRARLMEPEADIPSPTFTLVQTYLAEDMLEIWHADLYRLEQAADIEELGLEEAMLAGAMLIEWPERAPGLPPPDRLDIALSGVDEGRRAELTFHGPRWGGRIDRFG